MFKTKKLLLLFTITLGVIFYFGSVQAITTAPDDSTLPDAEIEATTSEEATEEAATEEEATTEETTVDSNLKEYAKAHYWAGETLDITGHFKNDVIAAGNNITIDGIVDGDVIATASVLTINGVVKGNVRAAAGNIIINGTVDRNVTVAGGQVSIKPTATINKDLIVYGGTVQVLSLVNGDITGGAGTITINNTVNGNVDLGESGQITLGDNANIAGNLKYISTPDTQNHEIAASKVQGKINTEKTAVKNKKDKKNKTYFSKYTRAGFWIWYLIKLMGILLVALVMAGFFKCTVKNTVEKMYSKPGMSFLYGLLIIFLFPPLCVLVMITVIGFPLGLIGLVSYCIALYLGVIFAGTALGTKMFPKSESSIAPAFVGTLIVYLVTLIPFVGHLICFLLVAWALGALVKNCCGCCGCDTTKPESKPVRKKATRTRKKTKK